MRHTYNRKDRVPIFKEPMDLCISIQRFVNTERYSMNTEIKQVLYKITDMYFFNQPLQ